MIDLGTLSECCPKCGASHEADQPCKEYQRYRCPMCGFDHAPNELHVGCPPGLVPSLGFSLLDWWIEVNALAFGASETELEAVRGTYESAKLEAEAQEKKIRDALNKYWY